MNSGELAAEAGATKHFSEGPVWEVKQSWDVRTLPRSAPVVER